MKLIKSRSGFNRYDWSSSWSAYRDLYFQGYYTSQITIRCHIGWISYCDHHDRHLKIYLRYWKWLNWVNNTIGLFKVWTAIKKKLVHVTASLDNDREKVPDSGPTDKTDEDREQVPVQEVDHDLRYWVWPDDDVTENGWKHV